MAVLLLASLVQAGEDKTVAEPKIDETLSPGMGGDQNGSGNMLLGGGPDSYGYIWRDSNDPGGPTYSWIDISGIGTEITSWTGTVDDGYTNLLPMGMTFSFYGTDYSSICVSTNGWASFVTQTSSYLSNGIIPSTSNPNALLAVNWDDLDGGTVGHCYYYYDSGANRFIISWVNWPYYPDPTGPHDFQVILNANDSSIVYQYGTGDYSHISTTVGIENETGTIGLQVVYNAAYLTNNLAVKFTRPPLLLHNTGVSAILTPGTAIFIDSTYSVTCRVRNYGSSTETNLQVHFVIKDTTGATVYDNSHVIPSIPTQTDSVVTFPSWTASEPYTHTLTACTVLPSDLDHSNDTTVVTRYVQAHRGNGGPVEDWTFADNISGGGPAFNWIDISGIGEALSFSSQDDANSGMFDMGMPFEYFGTTYSRVAVSTNGWLSFTDSTSTTLLNNTIPNTLAPNTMIALLWDDLHIGGGAIYKYYDSANNRFIVQYNNVEFYPSGGPDCIDMEVILQGNTIKMQYNNFCDSSQSDISIGIENQDGTLGLAYDNNGEVLQKPINGTAVTFTHSLLSHNIAAGPFLAPPLTGIVGVPVIPEVQFSNQGSSDETNVPVRLLITPGTYNNLQHIATLDSGSFANVNFASFTPATSAVYTLTAISELNTDQRRQNDTTVTAYTVYDALLDLEANDGGFLASGDWEWGSPTAGPGGAHSGVNCWGTSLDNYPTPSTTSDLDIPIQITGANASFTFYQWYEGSTISYYFRVLVDDGSGFVQLEQWQGSRTSWTQYVVDLSAYTGMITLRLEMQIGTTYTYDGWFVDDFAFLACHPYYPANDASVRFFALPDAPYLQGSSYSLQALVRNNGTNTISFNVQATDNHGYANTQAVSNLVSFGTSTVTFPGWTPTVPCVEYSLTATTQLGGDENPSNNSKSETAFISRSANFHMQYDDGVASNYWRFTNTTDIIATQFEVPYASATLSAVAFKFTNKDDFPVSPDTVRDPVNVYIFFDDDHDGQPDSTPVYQDTITTTEHGLTVWDIACETNLSLNCQMFWAGWSQVATTTTEAIVIDAATNYPSMKWAFRSGAWAPYNPTAGDPFIRAYVNGSAATAPDIELGSVQVSGHSDVGGADTVSNSIDNAGGGCDLEYSVRVMQNVFRMIDNAPAIPLAMTTIQNEKGSFDEPYYPPVTTGFGGPDYFGYTWIDSDEPTGPVYNWVDITGFGQQIPFSSDDQTLYPYDIGFTFNFYGNSFTTFGACTNGWLSFSDTSHLYNNLAIPSPSAPWNLVAPMWDDMNFSTSGTAYYYSNNVDSLVVSYIDVPHFSSGGPYTFQTILLADGSIIYQYQTINIPDTSATVGIQNYDGSDGLQIVFNARYLRNELAVKIIPPIFWLSTDLTGGTMPYTNPPLPFNIFMTAAELDAGAYHGAIRITSNDPDEHVTDVNVTYIVGNQPIIQLSRTSIVDTVQVAESKQDTLLIGNIGNVSLFYGLLADRPWISAAPDTGEVPASLIDTIVVTLDASSLSPGNFTGSIAVNSNDPSRPQITVPVSLTVTGGQGSCSYAVGDANGNGTFNGLDVTYSVAYFKGGPHPPYECECTPGNTWYVAGDVNASCTFNGLDVTYMVAYFKGGPLPRPCADCPPSRMGILLVPKTPASGQPQSGAGQ
jgi:hypothetical protein